MGRTPPGRTASTCPAEPGAGRRARRAAAGAPRRLGYTYADVVEGGMARQRANPVVRFLVALLVVLAVALVAFFVGYLIGTRLAGVAPFVPVWLTPGMV